MGDLGQHTSIVATLLSHVAEDACRYVSQSKFRVLGWSLVGVVLRGGPCDFIVLLGRYYVYPAIALVGEFSHSFATMVVEHSPSLFHHLHVAVVK